jgi:hypothetical protein
VRTLAPILAAIAVASLAAGAGGAGGGVVAKIEVGGQP